MKKTISAKWITALRSGKYKQGRFALKHMEEDTYCCLGVLCEISGKTYKPDDAALTQEIADWAGLKECHGFIEFKRGNLSLIRLNDERKRSFKQIAAYIERNWKRL